MMRILLPTLVSPFIAAVDPSIHAMCVDAKDYSGCVKMHERPQSSPDDARAWERGDGSIVIFDPKSVAPMEVRGIKGRYLSFKYRITAWDPGFSGVRTPIVSNTTFSGNSYYTTVTGGQLVGARLAGYARRFWTVECDCKEYTANWSGDFSGWIRVKQSDQDWAKEAVLIMDEFCPKIAPSGVI